MQLPTVDVKISLNGRCLQCSISFSAILQKVCVSTRSISSVHEEAQIAALQRTIDLVLDGSYHAGHDKVLELQWSQSHSPSLHIKFVSFQFLN